MQDLDFIPGQRVENTNERCACGTICTVGVLAWPICKMICWMAQAPPKTEGICSQDGSTVAAVVSVVVLSALCCIGLAIACHKHCRRPLTSDRVGLMTGEGPGSSFLPQFKNMTPM